jgi:hypothetical protein
VSEFLMMVPGRDDLRLRISVVLEEDNRFPTPLELPRWEEVDASEAAAVMQRLGISVDMGFHGVIRLEPEKPKGMREARWTASPRRAERGVAQ